MSHAKSFAAILWALAALFIFVSPILASWGPPLLGARAAALIEVATGDILYEKNGHVRLPMASTTKIMTGVLALERGDPDELVVISRTAAGVEGSSLYIRANEEYPLRDLVAGLLLRSGNDAAAAIAEHLAGGVSSFTEWMNEKAKQIGAENTQFRNPHGLPAEGHFTTAVDLARIAAYAMKVPGFDKIAAAKTASIAWPGHNSERTIVNRNKLLWEYEGANGIKTGYTRAAGRCFVGSAVRNGRHLIAVVLNSPAIWEETMSLLDYGFSRFKLVSAVKRGDVLTTVQVKGGMEESVECLAVSDLNVVIPRDLRETVSRRIVFRPVVESPVVRNQVLGSVFVLVAGEEKARCDLVAANDVPRKTVWDRIREWFGNL